MQIDPKGLEAAKSEGYALGVHEGRVELIVRAYLSALSPAMLVDMGSGRRWMTPAPCWASHLVEEGSTQSDEYTELALALTAAEARASSAEAQLAEMREALRKIVSCYDRNWQHQREKLDDIVPMARAALEQSQ